MRNSLKATIFENANNKEPTYLSHAQRYNYFSDSQVFLLLSYETKLSESEVAREGVGFGGLDVDPFAGAAVFDFFGYYLVDKEANHILFDKIVEQYRVALRGADLGDGIHEVGRKTELVVKVANAAYKRVELGATETAGDDDGATPCGTKRIKNILDEPIEILELLFGRDVADICAERSEAAAEFV